MVQKKLIPNKDSSIIHAIKKNGIDKHTISLFKKRIWEYYNNSGRKFPFREPEHYNDPYKIIVSEIMLQQTQAQRVAPKYLAFLEKFPDFKSLDEATNEEVLEAWIGLGYNRRALALKKIANIVLNKLDEEVPRDIEQLQEFPQVGPNTAASISTFAFNLPNIFIETNIRTVFIYFFFHDVEDVTDEQILELVDLTLDEQNPREWYYALMDYGVKLKKQYKNKYSRRSKKYKKQSKFKGSDRELRGKLLKYILKLEAPIDFGIIASDLKEDVTRVEKIAKQMEKEGFITISSDKQIFIQKD